MKIYTSEVEMLHARCREWEKVCDSHLRLIKKLKKERKPWVGLTDEERFEIADISDSFEDVVDATEAKLREKNGGTRA